MHPFPSLTSGEANKRLTRYGLNALRQKNPPSDLILAVSQLKNPLIVILLAAAGITAFLGDITDAGIIFLAILMNTVLGFFQERKAVHALAAINKLLVSRVRVRRDNAIQVLDATLLVPGDIVLLAAGDRIPADGKLLETVGLQVNESMLTGESMPINKNVDDPIFTGTTITSGRGVMQIELTGMRTKIGSIAKTLEETKDEATPLQKELHRLARVLALIIILVASGVFIFGILRGQQVDSMFSTAVALAVSAIPEGLVVTLTVILALGMQRILAKKAIVRRLVSAETLGSVTSLCVDKTGTLTQGVMKVTEAHLIDPHRALSAAVIANNLSDPIETALWEWAENQDHADPQAIVESQSKTGELPFDSKWKFMAVTTSTDIWVKGAPEILLAKSTLPEKEKNEWQIKIDRMAKKGLRIIAVACQHSNTVKTPDPAIARLTFLGIFGVTDPVRPEVADALAAIKSAGVSVKVITGDYRLTAETVLTAIGLPIIDPANEILEGKELAQLSEDVLARRIASIKLFCRVTPEQKLAIVSALKQNGEVVAMTGDGVNDALALQKADIGIVVANASDVAKETADMILLDSSFRTIVSTIEEGRVIFGNIRKVTMYLLSDSFTEILLISFSLLFGLPLPLAAAQILWINIISDGLPNLALAVEPKNGDELHIRPRGHETLLFSRSMKQFIARISIMKALLAFTLFAMHGAQNQTVVFAFISMGSLLAAFSIRTIHRPIVRTTLFANRWLLMASGTGFILLLGAIYHPVLSTIFHTSPLSPTDWGTIGVATIILLFVLEKTKQSVAHIHEKTTE